MAQVIATQSRKGLTLLNPDSYRRGKVPMSWYRPGGMYATWARPGGDLWTDSVEDCMTIATVDTYSGKRSLVHAPGGLVTEGYYDDLAQHLDSSTYIIVSNGSNWHDPNFMQRQIIADVRTKVRAALNKKGKKGVNPSILMYFTHYSHVPRNVQGNTFVLLSNGTYGRMGAAVDVPCTVYKTSC